MCCSPSETGVFFAVAVARNAPMCSVAFPGSDGTDRRAISAALPRDGEQALQVLWIEKVGGINHAIPRFHQPSRVFGLVADGRT
jgi:hypothetical protein